MSKKTYNLDVATTLAAKLTESKGVAYVTHLVGEGKYKVLPQSEVEAMAAGGSETTTVTGSDVGDVNTVVASVDVETAAAIAAGKSKAWANEVVQVTVPGKITKMYVITPEIGGRPRWFEIARLKSKPEADGGQVTFNCTRATLLSRKLKDMAEKAEPVAA